MFLPNVVEIVSVSSAGLAELRSCVLHQIAAARKFVQVEITSKYFLEVRKTKKLLRFSLSMSSALKLIV